MSATSALLRGRVAAERLMLDTCTVKRLSGQVNTPDTGQVVNTYTTVYSGKCKVQQADRSGVARPQSVGEAEVFMSRLQLHLPISATGVTSDDIATITASALDPDLVGKVFHVREPSAKTFLTARRFGIEQVAS